MERDIKLFVQGMNKKCIFEKLVVFLNKGFPLKVLFAHLEFWVLNTKYFSLSGKKCKLICPINNCSAGASLYFTVITLMFFLL